MGVSETWIIDLVSRGILKKDEKGRFVVREAVQAIYNHARDIKRNSTPRSDAKQKVSDLRAKELQLRIDERERKLITIEEHEAVFNRITGMILTTLVSLPAQITRDPEERKKVEATIDRLREDIARALVEGIEDPPEDGEDPETDEEDDT